MDEKNNYTPRQQFKIIEKVNEFAVFKYGF
jgi:hypothetical protein